MKQINLDRYSIYKGNLILITEEYGVREKKEEEKANFVPVLPENPEILMESRAAILLLELFTVITAKGRIIPISGYRSKEEQKALYENSIRDNGVDFTRKFVAYPGHSEHETGLAIDLAEKAEQIDLIRPEFPSQGICSQFQRMASKYGYIQRYQKGKESITKIDSEPWHFRYVGYPHSKLIEEREMALEEYISFIRNYPYQGQHLQLNNIGTCMEIFFVEKRYDTKNIIQVSEEATCQISGNNVDGYIITSWKTWR